MTRPETHAEYLKRAREIERSDAPAKRLAILASFTADFLRPYLIVESEALGCRLDPFFGPFNQLEQLVLDEESALWQRPPDVLWIALRIEDADPQLAYEFPSLKTERTRERLRAIGERLASLAMAARERFDGPILVSNLTLLEQEGGDFFDASDPEGLTHLVAEENRELARRIREVADAHVFDYAGCVARTGRSTWRDRRLWHMARAAVGREAQPLVARAVARAAAATLRPPAKVLVLDLDNTLWGGVLGDDGPEGIQIGDDHPGSVFKEFQSALLGYRHRGFLLAVASKNDATLARETLDSHPEMLLRSKDFAAFEVGWGPKSEGLLRMAEQLRLGLDSFVFVDDNPVEREEIRVSLPMVRVVELPPDPLGYLPALCEVAELDRPRLVGEDRDRAQMYQQEASRRLFSSSRRSLEEFLAGLEMEAEVGTLDGRTQERIHQLVQKTNQFNLTTRRHSLEAIRQLADSPDAEVAWLRLRDRFGDLGLVCVGIVRRSGPETFELDTFLMSCRVMGRHVEDAFLAFLAERAREHGARRLRAAFVRTAKNAPVSTFLPDRGFREIGRPDEDTWLYEADLGSDAFPWPASIRRQDAETR